MAGKPTPFVFVPTSTKKKLSYAQLRSLWIQAGGSPALASQMAAVALAESGGDPTDPWKIGYYETQREAKPVTLTSAAASAKAAVSRVATTGPEFWPTYQTGAWQPLYQPITPQEKAAASVTQGTATAEAKSASPTYIQTKAQLEAQTSAAVAQAKAVAHIGAGTEWVVKPTGTGPFTYATGPTPPKDVLEINGAPATKADLQAVWGAQYQDVYQAFTGRNPTPAQQAQIVESGVSPYGLRAQLSDPKTNPSFVTSPIYKQSASGLQAAAKTILGKNAPAQTVRRAISENWDQATFQAHLRASPEYKSGPEYKTNLGQMQETYRQIYGHIPPGEEQKIEAHTAAGWTPAEFGQVLRQQPSYKASPEYRQNVNSVLYDLGVTPPPAPVPHKIPNEAYEHGQGQPVPAPPSQNVEMALHQAGLTPAESKQLHQIWATSVNPDGSLNTAQAERLAQPIKSRLLGTSYVQANKPEIQQAEGSFGDGLLTAPQLQTLGEQEVQGGNKTPAGTKLEAAFQRAQQRMQGAFTKAQSSPAVSSLFNRPSADTSA